MSPDFQALSPPCASPRLPVVLPVVPSYVLVVIRKKNHIWVPPDDKVGDHAGSLIASMAIDLATKSSPKFKYTHEACPSFGVVSTSHDVCTSSALYNKLNLQKCEKIELIQIDDKMNRKNFYYFYFF